MSDLIDALVGLDMVFATILLVLIAYRQINSIRKVQQHSLIHDMIKEGISNWKYIHEKKKKGEELPEAVKSPVFNYYEHLAYLINTGKIPERQAIRIWKPDILAMYKEFEKDFSGVRKEMKKLYERWKDLND